ncbi:hypothetical protein J6590_035050 [Homalodisca vitripennis]|nr:hypothetical protein J6590_035050 [Homalodisca vitripennis]
MTGTGVFTRNNNYQCSVVPINHDRTGFYTRNNLVPPIPPSSYHHSTVRGVHSSRCGDPDESRLKEVTGQSHPAVEVISDIEQKHFEAVNMFYNTGMDEVTRLSGRTLAVICFPCDISAVADLL